MNMLPKTPAPWPSTSRLAVYWLVAVVVFEAADCSLLWHMDWFIAWVVSPFALITLTPVLLIMGVWLVVAGIVAGLRSRATPLRRLGTGLAPILAVAVGIGLTVPLHQGVGVAMTWGSLLLNRTQYASIIDQVRRGRIPPPGEGPGRQESPNGIAFEAERSGPRRIVFILPDHWHSDWQVILYDPAIAPSGAGRHADIDREEASLFDGWLKPYACWRMTGPYLSCYLSAADE